MSTRRPPLKKPSRDNPQRKDRVESLPGSGRLERWPRPSLAVDVVALTVRGGGLRVRLARRTEEPFNGRWALPGGFVNIDETIDHAARRHLQDKAGIEGVFLEQLYTFGDLRRDPRGRVVSIAHYALCAAGTVAGDSKDGWVKIVVPWRGETGGPITLTDDTGIELPLAFDHADIVGMAIKRLRGKLDYTPVGFQLLRETFTLRELQGVHEAILGEQLNKDSFRRRMLTSGLLEATGERESDVEHRPAELYRFTRRSAV